MIKVAGASEIILPKPQIDWIPPVEGYVKFNVDDAFNDSSAGCGGVLRSYKVDVRETFSGPVDIVNFDFAELVAIKTVSEIFKEAGWIVPRSALELRWFFIRDDVNNSGIAEFTDENVVKVVVLDKNINEWAKADMGDLRTLQKTVLRIFVNNFKEGSLEAVGPLFWSVSKTAMNVYARILAKKHPDFQINCVYPEYINEWAKADMGDAENLTKDTVENICE
ncbi:uncharacterized protein LOC120189594 [Hibiscus syriacus]|uniref:uncharacterized protein LOC120189594 n=1 Tax=Hibiscus syriacus TaxID=106335 RepID=UPI00192515F2|nr:uncharacterized protein LOC120189594 [Hibiscus syriacus]